MATSNLNAKVSDLFGIERAYNVPIFFLENSHDMRSKAELFLTVDVSSCHATFFRLEPAKFC